MSRFLCLALLGLALAILPARNAVGCNGRGGFQRVGYYGGPVVNVNFANQVRAQQQMQQAFLMQQQALAIQKAQKAEAKHKIRLANAEKHRAQEAAQRLADKEKRQALQR